MRSPTGSYSMVLLRRLVAGKVETQLVEGEFYSKAYENGTDDDASFNAPNVYKVIAVLDLDGDGKMEIVVYFAILRGRSNDNLSLRSEKDRILTFRRLRGVRS